MLDRLDKLAITRARIRLAMLSKARKRREVVFRQHIDSVEDFLQAEYKKLEQYIEAMEEKLKKGLVLLYGAADTELVNGVKRIKKSGNGKIKAKMNKFVRDWIDKMKDRLLSDVTVNRLFDPMRKEARTTILDNNSFLQLSERKYAKEFYVDESEFRSFERGYLSNMKGVLFNEPRRIHERIDEHFGMGAPVQEVLKQVGTVKMNRNIYKLSAVTHPRAAYKNTIFENTKDQFVFYKVIVPRKVESKLALAGKTAAMLYLIKTAAEWNQKDDKVADAVSSLGMHHGSQEYYYPILGDEIVEEREIAREQRAKFKKSFVN